MRHLLDEGAPAVVYLESDMALLGSVDEPAELARASGVALSPRPL